MRLWIALLSVGLMVKSVSGQTVEHPVLVELFTSEGCSSCPPADEVLRKMHDMHTAAGTLIVTLSEHVTYWNHDGWSDPYSDEIFTQRQAAYEERMKVAEAYTPQVVVMGAEQVNGSDGFNILKAVDAEKNDAVMVKIASTKVEGKKIAVTYSVEGGLGKKGADVYAVVTDDEATSNVTKGENKGRTITHVSVARSLVKVGVVKDGAEKTSVVTLPEGSAGHHVVLVVQESGVGKVLGVGTVGL